MKKNSKGIFLVEAVVIIALVTTIMAYVYPNVNKVYNNYKYSTEVYDQIEDIYTLISYKDWLTYEFDEDISCDNIVNKKDITSSIRNNITTPWGDLEALYIAKYLDETSDGDYDFNRYLKRMKKTSNDAKACRLIGVFNDDNNKKRYASIKIDKESVVENEPEYENEENPVDDGNEGANNE